MEVNGKFIESEKVFIVFFLSLSASHILLIFAYKLQNEKKEGHFLKTYIEERAIEVATFIINSNATVRETARKFGISKSTVHMDVVK